MLIWKKGHKVIGWRKADAPKNPFEAAACSSKKARIEKPLEENSSSPVHLSHIVEPTEPEHQHPTVNLTSEPSSSFLLPTPNDSIVPSQCLIRNSLSPASFSSDEPIEEDQTTSFVNNYSSDKDNVTSESISVPILKKSPECSTPITNSIENPTLFNEKTVNDELSCHASTVMGSSSAPQIPFIGDTPYQPKDSRLFAISKNKRPFQPNWFDNEDWKPWLHYDVNRNAAFCFGLHLAHTILRNKGNSAKATVAALA